MTTYQEYAEEKKAFFTKHNYSFSIQTSYMDEYGCWNKRYVFEDNAVWYEDYMPVIESGEAFIRGLKIPVEAKLLRTEYWDTDNSKSRYLYEKF